MRSGVVWNLFLAVVPVGLGYLLAWLLSRRGKGGAMLLLSIPVAVAWLLFLPNSCYLLTEWRHLLFDRRWEDLLDSGHTDRIAMFRVAKLALYFLLYSGTGVLLFVLAIRPVERWLRSTGQKFYFYAPFLFFLMSLGVYLGLTPRRNSWDMVQLQSVWRSTLGALTNQTMLLSIVVFAAVLWALYEAMDIWVDGIADRMPGKGGGGARKPARARKA